MCKGRRKLIQQIPEIPRMIIGELNASGWAAYVVGGAVRDILLKREPDDFDVATAARPEEVLALAHRMGWKTVTGLGQNYGVVLIIIGGSPVEVTTFRGESYGEDAHRPKQIWYTDSLEADLSRRDFTMNAMALGLDGILHDPFGGQGDITAKFIRAVGDPQLRFAEDALRMFRACRFAAELGFTIDQAILTAIPKQLERVAGLSLERVKDEMNWLLLADYPEMGLAPLVTTGLAASQCRARDSAGVSYTPLLPELVPLIGMAQNPVFNQASLWQQTLKTIHNAPRELICRWAALLLEVAKSEAGIQIFGDDGQILDQDHDKTSASLADQVMRRFAFGGKVCQRVVWLVQQHRRFSRLGFEAGQAFHHWLWTEARSGRFRSSSQLVEALEQLVALASAAMQAKGSYSEPFKAVAQACVEQAWQMPVGTGDLRYPLAEIAAILNGQEFVGPFLKHVLIQVQDGVIENCENTMIAEARKWNGGT